MPMLYRIAVTRDDETRVTFFATQGAANKAKREHKKATGEQVDWEKLDVRGKQALVDLLNNPSGGEADEEYESDLI